MRFPEIDAKLRGAQDRLNQLEGCINEGAVTNLLTYGADRDRQGRVRVRVKKLAEIPQEWHVWIGECVHDMRSALDHLAYALNVVGSGADPPPNWGKSQFPIYSLRRDFREMCRVRRKRPDKCMVGFFPRGARTSVERLQPYHRWKDIEAGWLEVLAELSNIDKHRGFPLTPVTPMLIAYPTTVEGHPVAHTKAAPYGALKPNTTIMWLEVPTLPPSVKEPDVQFPYAGGLNFQRTKTEPALPLILPFEPADYVLRKILGHIRNTVLPTLEPYLR